jgi:exodeoxyribonuclease III
MRIVTWNINSVRLRAPLLLESLIKNLKPDVLCLQETKTPDEFFPHDIFDKFGFKHRHINGMKSYNGVAIVSKIPLMNPRILSRVKRDDCRHIAVTVNGFDLHNIYIPAGGDIPDRGQNEKFGHKLDFVDDLKKFFVKNHDTKQKIIAVGDFNIAPLEHDVWSHKQLLNVVSHTPIEVEKLSDLQKSLNWHDAIRHFVPHDQKCYTWWSYRNQDWRKSNRGRRLDHMWVTQPVASHIKSHCIHADARDWDKASDHVPVMIELKA